MECRVSFGGSPLFLTSCSSPGNGLCSLVLPTIESSEAGILIINEGMKMNILENLKEEDYPETFLFVWPLEKIDTIALTASERSITKSAQNLVLQTGNEVPLKDFYDARREMLLLEDIMRRIMNSDAVSVTEKSEMYSKVHMLIGSDMTMRLYRVFCEVVFDSLLLSWPLSCYASPGIFPYLDRQHKASIVAFLILWKRSVGSVDGFIIELPREMVSKILGFLWTPRQFPVPDCRRRLKVLENGFAQLFRVIVRDQYHLRPLRCNDFLLKIYADSKELIAAVGNEVFEIHKKVEIQNRPLHTELSRFN